MAGLRIGAPTNFRRLEQSEALNFKTSSEHVILSNSHSSKKIQHLLLCIPPSKAEVSSTPTPAPTTTQRQAGVRKASARVTYHSSVQLLKRKSFIVAIVLAICSFGLLLSALLFIKFSSAKEDYWIQEKTSIAVILWIAISSWCALQSACYLSILWYKHSKSTAIDEKHNKSNHTVDIERGDRALDAMENTVLPRLVELDGIGSVQSTKEGEIKLRMSDGNSGNKGATKSNSIDVLHSRNLQNKTRDQTYQDYSGDLSAFSFSSNYKPATPSQSPHKSGRTRDPNYEFYSGDLGSFNFSSPKQPQPVVIASYIADAVPYLPPKPKRMKRSYAMQDLHAASAPSLPLPAFATLPELPSFERYSLHSDSGIGDTEHKISRPKMLPKSKSDPKAAVRRLEVIYSEPEEDSAWEDDSSDDDELHSGEDYAEKRSENVNDSGVVV